MKVNLKEQFNGIQHIGIPTNDLVHFLPSGKTE